VVIYIEQGANDLHVIQLMPLPPHHLLLAENPDRFVILVPAYTYTGCLGKRGN